MKTWLTSLAVFACLSSLAFGNEAKLNQDNANRQRCSGMYSRKSWGGSLDPFILVKFLPHTADDNADPLTSLVIFEWKDEDLIGVLPPGAESYRDKQIICDPDAVAQNLCKEEQVGAYILSPNATDDSQSAIFNEAIHLKDPKAINYPIRKTGYYCVSSYAYSNVDYSGVIEFRNSYGELPAAQIAKLPFYGGLTITYIVLGLFWAFLYVQNRHDILPVQNYITATLIFLIVEQLMTWGFYDHQNRAGNNAANKVFLVIVSILNAGRNSLSFFLLLIVCMGYGVVKPTLGKTMIYVRILAIVHFVFGVIYAVASLAVTPDTVGPIVLFVILPLAATLTAFYVWTLSSLNLTMKDLIDRKQKTKALMYKRLWWCILGSVMVIFAFFFVNSFAFAGSSEANFVPEHWQTRWFVLDGWLNIVYLFDIAFISYLWRPTANNRRFAMSDEIAQDDDGTFDLRSDLGLNDSLDDLTTPTDPRNPSQSRDQQAQDLEAAAAVKETQTQPSGPIPATSLSSSFTPTPHPQKRQADPLPPDVQTRGSLDGETIFAVGDEDEWSDGEMEETGRMMGKKS